MFYLIWALLNITLLIFFIRVCITATKLLRERVRITTSIVFVCGLLFIGCSNNNSTSQDKIWTLTKEDSLNQNSELITTTLEKTLTTDYYLDISYRHDSKQNNIPLSASTRMIGLICGINWKPSSVTVKKIDNQKFQYFVNGALEWRLLGTRIYTQDKSYEGIAFINNSHS